MSTYVPHIRTRISLDWAYIFRPETLHSEFLNTGWPGLGVGKARREGQGLGLGSLMEVLEK